MVPFPQALAVCGDQAAQEFSPESVGKRLTENKKVDLCLSSAHCPWAATPPFSGKVCIMG